MHGLLNVKPDVIFLLNVKPDVIFLLERYTAVHQLQFDFSLFSCVLPVAN
jgi:hypothetical protein